MTKINCNTACFKFVLQDTVLFHDSIYHNIAYGDLNASKEQVYNAAKMADVHEAILNMPQKYETQVGLVSFS